MTPWLSPRQRRTVEAFAEAFIAGRDVILTPKQITDNIDDYLACVQSKRTASLRIVLFVVEYIVPLLALRGPFSRQSLATRRRIIARHLLAPRAGRLLHDLAKIRTLFLAGYYGDADVYPSISFTAPRQQSRYTPDDFVPLPRAPLVVKPPTPNEPVIEADVCVVGSGAGGAVIACLAAESGARVVVVEEGKYFRPDDLNHNEPRMSAMLYKESGLQSTVDLDLVILQGRAVGGTTIINNAICFRIGDDKLNQGRDTLDQWARLGAHIDPAALEASYAAVERVVCPHPVPDVLAGDATAPPHTPAGANGDLLLDGWKTLVARDMGDPTFKHNVFRLNLTDCLACGFCNFGCPYGRRLSVLETYLAKAVAAGARVMPECHAIAIETGGRRARGVRIETADGQRVLVRAGRVVVSCGTIGSSVLLLKSGIPGPVGTRFSCNIATPVLARLPRVLNSIEALEMTAYVDATRFIMESSFSPPMSFSAMLPGWFETHFDRMRAYGRFVTGGVVVGTEANGRVQRFALLRNLLGPVDYRMTPSDLATLKQGMALIAELYFAAGAEAVFPSTFVDHEMLASRFAPNGQIDRPAIQRHIDTIVQQPGDITLSTAHPQGGNPMSDDPRIGVVDSTSRVHGFENLFVCDASVFPTSLGINPQLTVMALADYAWHHGVAPARVTT